MLANLAKVLGLLHRLTNQPWQDKSAHEPASTSIHFTDARGAKRHLLVVQHNGKWAIAESLQTAYLTPETVLTLGGTGGKKKHATLLCQINSPPGALRLHTGGSLRLTKEGLGQTAGLEDDADELRPDTAHVPVALPQVIDQAKVGERIWFDDGRIGGVVGLSFVRKPADIALLREHLQRLDREDMGMVLKIETLQGFENLPELILSAMTSSLARVMMARGDLAVECGFERLAEVQEEMLWCAEAAHRPVIWATLVLEFMARNGLPSRVKIPNADLGVRAECIMLDKGPYMTQAIRTLDDILQRMGGHQAKKRPVLRAPKAWRGAGNLTSDAMLGVSKKK